jgi:hypothetical protein
MGVICHHTMSLDGYVAGPDDSIDWAFAFGEPTSLADETMKRIGAIVAGRRWYDLAVERWNGVDGIYNGAYQGPVFVLTHRAPAESASPRISSVSDGIEAAVAPAQAAAGDKMSGSSGRPSADRACRPGCSTRSSSTSRRCSSTTALGSTAAKATGRSICSDSRSAKGGN